MIRSLRRSALVAVAVTLTGAAVVLAGGGAPEVGLETRAAPPDFEAAVGDLTMYLTGTPRFEYVEDGTVRSTQSLANTGCVIQTAASPLVTLSGPAGTSSNGMGVYGGAAKGGRGTPCSRVELSQILGWAFDGAGLAGRSALSLDLDMEMKGSAIAVAKLYSSKSATPTVPVYTEKLFSGLSSGRVPASAVNAQDEACAAGSDSGPDSGPNDNCPWTVAPPSGTAFDRVTFSLYDGVGAFSIDDGGDYGTAADQHRTVVHFTDVGTLNCGDSFTDSESAGGATDTVTRLDNYDGSPCLLVRYRSSISRSGSDVTVDFVKDLALQPTAQYLFEIDWRKVDEGEDTRIVFDTDPSATPRTIEPCAPTPAEKSGSVLVPLDLTGVSPDAMADAIGDFAGFVPTGWWNDSSLDMVDDSATDPDYFEYACVLYEQTVQAEPGSEYVYQWIYVTGDLKMLR